MLIQCPECELPLSDMAISCPHCGYPMKGVSSRRRGKTNRRRRLPNGFGQISEIKGRNLRKPFRAMITVGKTETGRPICKPLKPDSYFETYNDAYSALVAYNKNPYDIDENINMSELFDRWFSSYHDTVSHNHARALERAWNRFTNIHGMKVSDVRARHLKGCIEECDNSIIKVKMKTVVNLMLDYAVEYEMVDQNYAKTFDLPKDITRSIREAETGHIPFSDDEMNILWSKYHEKRFADLILIQCYSGWRPDEMLDLKIENINLDDWTFTGGNKTDAGKNRTVPIHPRIRELVKNHYDESVSIGSKYLFSNTEANNQSKKISYTVYHNHFDAICAGFGLNMDHRPHDGRKHFVTQAKKYHVDEYAIKYMVGHSIKDITENIYTDRSIEWLQNEIAKIE